MKSIFCFAIIVFKAYCLAVCAANCTNIDLVTSKNLPDSEGRLGIYDGKQISIEKAPYTVAINVIGSFTCAGAILNKKWIATIGNCVYQRKLSELTVVAGSSDGVSGQKYNVDKIVVHLKFNPAQLDYDFALVRTSNEFKWSEKVKPINLPSQAPQPNTEVVASGYGDTKPEELDGTNGHLTAGVLYWQSKKFCKEAYSTFSLNWTPRMACAYNQGKTTLCFGDWADPLVYNNTLLGMYIAGAAEGFCSSHSKPCILTNVYSLVKWIRNVIKVK